MDCKQVLDRLEDFLDGRGSAGQIQAGRIHAGECVDCRELLEILGEDPGGTPITVPPGMTRQILRETSGAPCESARKQLGEYVDRMLGLEDAELIRLHLSGCEDCSGLSSVMVRMSDDLPLLAELTPDAGFVEEVLAGTGQRRRPAISWAARLAASWTGLLQRPRFAWEGAYIGTMMFILLFGIPTSPLAGVSRMALDLLQKDLGPQIPASFAQIEGKVSSTVEGAQQTWQVIEVKVTATSQQVRADVAARTTTTWEKITGYFGTLGTIEEPDASLPKTNETDPSPLSTDDEE